MRSLADVLGVAPVGALLELGDEPFTGGVVRPRMGVSVTGGVLTSPISIYNAVGFLWEGWNYVGADIDSGCCIGMLGGSDWTLLNGHGTGGRAYGQLQVGLDQSSPAGHQVPMRWTIDHCNFVNNGIAKTHLWPQDHSLYVLTSPEVDMKGVVRDCSFGPSLNGAVVKIGGTGGNPGTEGSNGVTVERTLINLHADNAPAMLLQGANTRNIDLDVRWTRPGQIRATDGARATFHGPPSPGRTFVTTWWPNNTWLRFSARNTTVVNGRGAPGIAWR
jgi:hypothetical protein